MSASGDLLLDTNIVVALVASEQAVIDRLARATRVFIPSTVIGELYYGAFNSSRVTANGARVDALVLTSSLLSCGADTARWYGQVKSQLRQIGRPIPENDLWIAAAALEHGLILLTRDAHFTGIAGLVVEAV
jgi:tRNA(fMet)-specific endonuclease VapC